MARLSRVAKIMLRCNKYLDNGFSRANLAYVALHNKMLPRRRTGGGEKRGSMSETTATNDSARAGGPRRTGRRKAAAPAVHGEATAQTRADDDSKTHSFSKERKESVMDLFQTWGDMNGAGKKAFEAWIASGKIAADGWTAIGGKMVGAVAASVEGGVAASEKALECKDLAEFADLQAQTVQRQYDIWLKEGRAVSDLTLKTATDAMAPLTEQVNTAFAEWTKPTA